jgi:hypothetical protein
MNGWPTALCIVHCAPKWAGLSAPLFFCFCFFYYTIEIIKLQKELRFKQWHLQTLQEVNDGLRWASAGVTW